MRPILVIQGARFGDLVQSKRLLMSLQSRGEIHLGVDKSLIPLARYIYPDIVIHGLHIHGRPDFQNQKENEKILAQWRDLNFQTIYNCNFSPLTAALCRCFEHERVIGYRPSANGILRSPWVRTVFQLSEKRRMTPLNLMDFWAYFVTDPLAADKINKLPTSGAQGIGVVLAGRESRRSIPIKLLSNIVLCVFYALGGPKIKLLGTNAEQAIAHKLMHSLPKKIHSHIENLSGKTDWIGLVKAVEGADILITPDTGTMHLGAHLAVPVLAFFLSSALCHETGPYGQGHYVFQASCNCAPCLESSPCHKKLSCIASFQSANFLPALEALLKNSSMEDRCFPADLQLWKSDLDNLGESFQLCAGVDEYIQQRAYLRRLLQYTVNAPPQNLFNTTDLNIQISNIAQWLYRDTDWMLPPERYC